MSTDHATVETPTETPIAAPAGPKPARAKPKASKKPVKKAKTVKPPAKKHNGGSNHSALSGLAAAHPKWEGKTCNFRRDGSLTARQIAVLNVLSKRSRPAAAADVAAALKIPEASHKTVNWAIGAVRTETPDPFSLLGRKLVKHVEVPVAEGRNEHLFEISAPGRKALEAAKRG